jgi:hypothetical protein
VAPVARRVSGTSRGVAGPDGPEKRRWARRRKRPRNSRRGRFPVVGARSSRWGVPVRQRIGTPDRVRAITRRWISLVPSKIV